MKKLYALVAFVHDRLSREEKDAMLGIWIFIQTMIVLLHIISIPVFNQYLHPRNLPDSVGVIIAVGIATAVSAGLAVCLTYLQEAVLISIKAVWVAIQEFNEQYTKPKRGE